MTSFCYHYTEEWDPVVHSAVVLNSSPAGKGTCTFFKSALINAWLSHGRQHFTAAAVQRKTWVNAEQHRQAVCVAERAVSWWQVCPRVYGWHINIWQYQYTFIDGLQRPVTYPLREVFEDEMLSLMNWVEPPDAIIRGRTTQQQKENVNIYLLIRAGSAMWTSDLMTQDHLIWLITWWEILIFIAAKT